MINHSSLIIYLCTGLASAAEEATHDSSRGQGLFSGSFADALWTVVAFVTLLVVLSRLAWRPMLQKLKAREQYIQQQIDAANIAHRQAEKLLDEYKQQGIKIVKQAADEAQQRQEELLERAGREVLTIKQKAQADIEYARTTALEQLWNEAGSIVLSLSQEVLGRKVTQDDDNRLIQNAVEQIRQNMRQSPQ